VKHAVAALLLLTSAAPAADLLIDFAPGGPRVVRVEATLDGKPAEPLWEAAVDDLFKVFDANGDGKLDKVERERLGSPVAPRRGTAVAERPASEIGFFGKLLFDAKAETIDRAGFAAALRTAGFGPVTLTTQSGRPENPALTAALFKHLDADGDGKLSPAELKNARAALAAHDVNEDEWLTAPELLGRAVSGVQPNQVQGRVPNNTPAAASDWLVLQGDEAATVKALLLRGGAKATTPTAKDLAMPETAFKKLDANGDGKLDAAELAAWLREPPELTVTIALSSQAGKSRVTPHDLSPTPDGRQVTFEGESGAVGFPQQRDALIQAFLPPSAPKDAGPSPATPDGEVGKRGAAFAAGYQKFAACRASVELTDRGRSLFDWLDTDANGRLSPRELNAAAGRREGNPLTPEGVPRQVRYRVHCSDQPLAVPSGGEVAKSGDAPAWFARMDRNGDGDVSLKEFLGPLELFRKLDADGDGLVSAAEARKR
jgi:Ca2+-binding EF-hand superfamily protein